MTGFWRTAAAYPEAVALITPDGREILAAELLAGANRVAHGLRAAGVSAGDTIAIALPNGRAAVETWLAALQSGVHAAPLDRRLTPAERARLVAAAGAKLVVEEDLGRDQPATAPAERRLGAPLYFTSGTTGVPRPIRRALPELAPDRASALIAERRLAPLGLAPRDGSVHLVVAPLHHSATLAWCMAHLHHGHTVVLTDGWSSEGVLAAIARHRVSGAFMVPTHFARLLALPAEVRACHDVGSLRHVVHGGAPCPPAVKRAMLAWWGPVIHEVYGAAELGIGTAIGPDEWLAHPGSVGRAGPHIRVVRADGGACAPGEIGAVCFDAPGEPRTVGDLGYVDGDGWLFLCDRASDVIISGGVNVYPAEVEAVLGAHPAVTDAAVLGVPDAEWGERVVAAVVAAAAVAEAELIAFCRERITAFKCPRAIAFTDALPRSESGKLLRRELRTTWVAR